MRHVVLVTGPPCAGKTTYVQRHARPGDVVLDRDAIGARAMRHGLERVAVMAEGMAWVIRSVPDGAQRQALAEQLRADEVLVLLPEQAELVARAQQRPDPVATLTAISAWRRAYTPCEADTPVTCANVPVPDARPALAW